MTITRASRLHLSIASGPARAPRTGTFAGALVPSVIMLLSLLSAGVGAAQAQDRGANVGMLITIEAVGQITTGQSNGPNRRMSNCSRPAVSWKEVVRGKAALNSDKFKELRLQAIIRYIDGTINEKDWRVQSSLVQPVSAEWKMNVQFGTTSDEGKTFELQVIATRDPLPPGLVPQGMVDRVAISKSDIVRVRRKAASSVSISHIDGEAIRGDDVHNVNTISPVEVVSAQLPSEAVIGLVVEPVSEDTMRVWVMNDVASGGVGTITTHFGEPRQDNFKEYQVFAFAVCSEDFSDLRAHQRPADRYSMPLAEWQDFLDRLRKADGFLVMSRPVRTKKWEQGFQITRMNKSQVQAAGMTVPGVIDVEGIINRPLASGEEVWVICLPSKGDPWIAGSTSKIYPDGTWRVTGAELSKSGRAASFGVVALITAESPSNKSAERLRDWINRAEQSDTTVRVVISNE